MVRQSELLPQLPKKIILTSKVVKCDPKITMSNSLHSFFRQSELTFSYSIFLQGILGMLSTINDSFFFKCYQPLGDLMDDIALINSSINFIIYSFMSKQFRKTFLETFGLVNMFTLPHFLSISISVSLLPHF